MMCLKPYYVRRRDQGSVDREKLSEPRTSTVPCPPTEDSNTAKGTFRPFDQQSYKLLNARIKQAQKDYGFVPHRASTLQDGNILPRIYEPVPEYIYGRPVEEFDGVSYEKTFCVISKRFSKNYLSRFSATRAFYIFSPWNPLRRLALFISTNQYFDYFVILTILVNCVFLALSNSIEEAEYVFLSIYTSEMVIKVIAKGFIINKYTYLRSPWNWLDFVVIVLGFITIFVELGNLSGLRTFRVLRALKTVSILPGLKTIVNALLHSISMLTEVMALTIFCLMVFALFGLQIFMGSFRRKCIDVTSIELNDTTYKEFIQDPNNWYENNKKYQLCGNSTGAWQCPQNYTCFPNIGDNPNFGYTSFDNFGWAMLATFQLLTLDFWEDIYNNIIATCGPSSVIFFIFTVFFGAFYLINLMLAVVAMSYEEEVSSAEAEKRNRELTSAQRRLNETMKSPNVQRSIIVTRRGAISITRSRQNLKDEVGTATPKQSKPTPNKTKNGAKAKESNGQNEIKSPTNNTSSYNQLIEVNDKRPTKSIQSGEKNHLTLFEKNVREPFLLLASIPGAAMETLPQTEKIESMRNGCIKETEPVLEEKKSESKINENSSQTSIVSHLKNEDSLDAAITNSAVIKTVELNQTKMFLQDKPQQQIAVLLQPRYADRNCSCCSSFCCYCFYRRWLQFQKILYAIVRDPFFELFITMCIIFNTVFLAIEHHGMSQNVKHVLNMGNKVFTVIFTFEAVLKLLALSKQYFNNGWNVFDLIAVIGSLIDLSLENFNGLSVLRALRLLRVFKLAQSWTTMKLLLSIILSAIGALGHLTFVLIIVMYIFAVLGMQLFGASYKAENFSPEEVPRWNFKDFPHSFLMTFRILCGEWIEALWDCMRANGSSGQTCIALFLPALIMENFLVLNLFLALLLSSFNSDKLSKTNNKDEEVSRLAKSFRRLRYILTCCTHKRNAVSPVSSSDAKSNTSQQNEEDAQISLQHDIIPEEDQEEAAAAQEEELNKPKWGPLVTYVDKLVNGTTECEVPQNGIASTFYDSLEDTPEREIGNGVRSNESPPKTNCNNHNQHTNSQVKFVPSVTSTHSSHNDDKVSDKNNDETKENVDNNGVVPVEERWPEDCFPETFYKNCSCCTRCLTSNSGQIWFLFRRSTLLVVDHPSFDWIILILIIASSICLCFEDVYLEQNQSLKIALHYLNILFIVVFTLEMILKWIAHGFVVYFTNVWTILDFIIVLVAIFSLAVENSANLTALRSMRTFRALRPLRAISRWQGMKIVVNALVSSIPSIVNVLLVCIVFWLVFSIMGVQFFAGKFYKCVDEDEKRLPRSVVNNRSECIQKNYTWENSNVNFDHVGQGFLALFQIATFEGWLEILADAVDSRDVDLQPEFEANMLAHVYFIVFIVCGSFFTLNLFIGVIIDNFNMLKKKYEGGVLDMFLTDSQKNYYVAMKKLGRKKPQKLINRPKHRVQIFFYNLCMNRKFEMAVFIVIMLNMLSMGVEHYEQPYEVTIALDVINIAFTSIFTLEAIVKIIAFRQYYFTVPWNIFDIVLVASSILGIILKDILTGFFISPTLLRVIRVFRIGRVLRLIKAAKGIRKLIFALMVSLPALFNIGALLFLIMFIYAIMGMSLFGYIKHDFPINEMTNFETFGNSVLLLFRLITSAGWSDILGPLMISPPDCDPHFRNLPNGDCGNPTLAVIFLVSYIMINNMIVINMYIAVILENFNQAHQEEELGIVEDDIEMFYVHWANFDPLATQFIDLHKVSDFLGGLDPPLRVPKPNVIALVSFNLPIAKGNKIHCLDILHALIKHVLGHVDETTEFQKLRSQMEEKFKKQFPNRRRLDIVSSTMLWKQQEVAARILQRGFRRWQRRNRPEEIDCWSRSMSINVVNSVARMRKLPLLRNPSCNNDGRSLTPSRYSPKGSTTRPSSTNSVQSADSHSSSNVFYVLPEG